MRAQRRDVGVYASSEGSLLKVAFMRAKGVCLRILLYELSTESA